MKTTQAPEEFTVAKLEEDILREARTIKLPDGAAEAMAKKVSERVAAWVSKRATITAEDLNRQVALELMKYNADLAYVYQNRGKII